MRQVLIDICNLPSYGQNSPIDLVMDYSYQLSGTLQFETPSWLEDCHIVALKMFKDEKIVFRLGAGIHVLNAITHQRELKINVGHSTSVDSLLILDEQRLIVSGCKNGKIVIYSIDTGDHVYTFNEHTNCINSIIKLPLGDTMIASVSTEPAVRIWNINSHQVLYADGVKGFYHVKAIDDKIIATSKHSHIFIWDYVKGIQLHSLHALSFDIINIMTFDKNLNSDNIIALKNTILVSNSSGFITKYNILTGECQEKVYLDSIASLVHISDNTIAAGMSNCGNIYIIDISTMKITQILTEHLMYVNALNVLMDGRLISSSIDGIIYIWDTITWQCDMRLHRTGISNFLPLKKNLITANRTGRISFYM